jgi:hypothetical protein
MTIRVSSNKNSTYNTKTGRYVLGGVTETSWALEWWNRVSLVTDQSDLIYFVEKIYESQPRKLALLFYGDEELWWVICQYNGLLDPVSDLIEGKQLLIPMFDRIKRNYLVPNPMVGGIPSTRIV